MNPIFVESKGQYRKALLKIIVELAIIEFLLVMMFNWMVLFYSGLGIVLLTLPVKYSDWKTVNFLKYCSKVGGVLVCIVLLITAAKFEIIGHKPIRLMISSLFF